jgi:hypothetical protein
MPASREQIAESSVPSLQPATLSATTSAPSVVVVYQDRVLKNWVRQFGARLGRLVRLRDVRVTWWKLSDLAQPAVLAGAVSVAIRADWIVVAIRATDEPPLPFYVWVQSWLPHRQGSGALLALLALSEHPPKSDRTREYLREVASQGRLEFLIEERKLAKEA